MRLTSRSAFSLLELLLFAGIFTVTAIAFIAVLTVVTRLQVRQSAAAEVNQQSQFLLQTMQQYIESSSLVDMSADAATTTLKLRMAASSSDPTYIYLTGSTVYLKQTDSGTPQPLTSSRVNVSGLTFTKHSNPPGHDSVSIVFTVSYNTQNPQQQLSQALDTAIARVSAATFDSNLIPSTTAAWNLGVTGQIWNSVNNTIYFSGSNVGIGTPSPQQTLEVNGVVRLNTTAGQPTCNANARGTIWVSTHTSSATDTIQVCLESSDNTTFFWARLY